MAKRALDLEDYSGALSVRKAWRFGLWGAVTLSAVAAAALAANGEAGSRRLAGVGTAAAGSSQAAPLTARQFNAEIELRRLSETVRLLSADRDGLLTRISQLERNLGDVTGSVPTNPAGARTVTGNAAASPTRPATTLPATPPMAAETPPASAPPRAAAATIELQGSPSRQPAGRLASAPPAAVETGAVASVATKTEFGIDLGSAATIEGLRNLWSAIKGGHAPLLEGLRPIIAIRDASKAGAIELRLVAGPLANASIAARLCAAIAAAGIACQPAVFDGQRLALN